LFLCGMFVGCHNHRAVPSDRCLVCDGSDSICLTSFHAPWRPCLALCHKSWISAQEGVPTAVYVWTFSATRSLKHLSAVMQFTALWAAVLWKCHVYRQYPVLLKLIIFLLWLYTQQNCVRNFKCIITVARFMDIRITGRPGYAVVCVLSMGYAW